MEEQVKEFLKEHNIDEGLVQINGIFGDYGLLSSLLTSFGKQQWNAACDKCAESAEAYMADDGKGGDLAKVSKGSILKNKLP